MAPYRRGGFENKVDRFERPGRFENKGLDNGRAWPSFILATPDSGQPSLWEARHHFGQPSFRPALVLAHSHVSQPSLCPIPVWPTNPHLPSSYVCGQAHGPSSVTFSVIAGSSLSVREPVCPCRAPITTRERIATSSYKQLS